VIELAFSILASDFAHLADDVAAAERGGGTIVHVDVMDGHFVPNITFGPPMVKALRPITRLPLDCHLMIENPDAFLADFAAAGADMISVHQEVCRHLHRTLQVIEQHGMKPAVVINPATPVETLIDVLPMLHHVLVMSVNPGFGGQKFLPLALEKIAHLVELREEMGLNFRIEVDGGVAHDTVAQVVQAGADMLVAGSAVFGSSHEETERNARELLLAARAAAPSAGTVSTQ
jgi:ribulose-phosphate 3-epimerase